MDNTHAVEQFRVVIETTDASGHVYVKLIETMEDLAEAMRNHTDLVSQPPASKTPSVRRQIINSLSNGPLTAAELISAIAVDQAGDQRRRTYAAVYRVLSSLQRDGIASVVGTTDKGRNQYGLTAGEENA